MAEPIITGTWIDVMHVCPRDGVYWNRKTIAYTDEQWAALIRHLRRDLGIELLMLQNIAKDGISLYPSKVMEQQWPTGCADPVGAIFRACSAEGVQLFPGIGYMKMTEGDGFGPASKEALTWYQRVSDEIFERYGSEPSFAGWYTAAELCVWNGEYNMEHIKFNGKLGKYWKELTPNLPSIASPYIRGEKIQRSDKLVKAVAESGMDIIAYQDGIGFTTKSRQLDPRDNEYVFETLKWVHDQTPVKLWANTELFRFENDIHFQPLLPGPFERIRTQIKHAAPHVERIVAYTMPGIMTSQEICPELGVPETERLYWSYKGYREAYQATKEGR
ncbi:MAG: DUF4434 domain-containing protein [Armatimonadota bacterium]